MKNKRIIFLSFLCMFTFASTGCGTKLEKLSESQEDQIIAYASSVVGRYNTNQDKGFIKYYEEKKSEDKDEDEEDTKKEEKEDSSKDTEDEEKTSSESSKTDSSSTSENESTTSINDALAVEGMTFEGQATKVVDKYTYGDYVSLRPDSGNSYLVYTVKGKNTSSQDVNLDLLSKKYKYNFTINGTEAKSNDTTILLNDLSTYQDNVKPGEEVELVLLFQFSSSKLKDMTSQSMEMVKDGQAIKIGL